jgi:ATP-dependent RNA helicase MSS116
VAHTITQLAAFLLRCLSCWLAGYKAIVFFTTARLTQYMASLVSAAGLPVLEIHSRKSQVGGPAVCLV